jgi:hypothetical protein
MSLQDYEDFYNKIHSIVYSHKRKLNIVEPILEDAVSEVFNKLVEIQDEHEILKDELRDIISNNDHLLKELNEFDSKILEYRSIILKNNLGEYLI